MNDILSTYNETLSLFKSSVEDLTAHLKINLPRARTSIERLIDLSSDETITFQSLACIRRFDEYTFNHCLNVAILSINFGKKLEFKRHWLCDLALAALFHDIGKLLIPTDILNKRSALTSQELEYMRAHPILAAKLLYTLTDLDPSNIPQVLVAFEHHRRFDLQGYPKTRVRKEQNIFSRIISICDTYDAMTSNRVYQRRCLPEVCLKIMAQGHGTTFDPVLLKAFIGCMGEYPVGSVVRLNTDEIGVVIKYKPSSMMNRPIVRVVSAESSSRVIDLMHPKSQQVLVVRSEFPEDHGIDVMHELFGGAA